MCLKTHIPSYLLTTGKLGVQIIDLHSPNCIKPSWRQFSALHITVSNQQLIQISMKPGKAWSKFDMFLCIHTTSKSVAPDTNNVYDLREIILHLPLKSWLQLNHLGSFACC